MSVKGEQLRLGVFAVVLGLACVNALALWGIEPARWGYTALQACTGAAAMVCAGVTAFRNHGVARLWRVKVALDDFGAGYNSLTYLHALPVQIIKLDRGLTVGSEPHRIETLYRSVIRLCDALDLEVVAEGIESTAQADTVYAAGCRLAQGHLFGRAAPITNLSFPDAVSGTVGA